MTDLLALQHHCRRDPIDSVFSNPDLLLCVLSENIGPSTYVAVSGVSKMCHELCRSSEELLRSVTRYCGGATATVLCGVLALRWKDARELPHTVWPRKGGGTYYLFGDEAVARVLMFAGA